MIKQVLFWQVRIRITQSPQPFLPKENTENNDSNYHEIENFRSFLIDLFGPNQHLTYGLEIIFNKKVEITFFTRTKSKLNSIEIGQTWLTYLKSNFLGLDGEIDVIPITESDINKYTDYRVLEIVLPDGLLRYKINFLENFLKIFYLYDKFSIRLLFYWKRELKSEDKSSNLYDLRFFLVYNKQRFDVHDLSRLKGILRYLCINIETLNGKRAYLTKIPHLSINELLKMDIFDDLNPLKSKYAKDNMIFDFPDSLPLPKIPILDYENVRYIDINENFIERAVKIGRHIKNGLITNHETYLLIDKLAQDLVVFGKSGSGKTYFLVKLIQELSRKTPNTGILILNVAKQSQEIYYNNFNILKYGDKDFSIPYFIKGISLEKSLLETASYICASLGLKNVFEKMIYYTEMAYIKTKGELPNDLIKLLKSVERYLESNSYGKEVQSNLLQALRNRINVLDNDKIKQVVKIYENFPKWVENWLNGKNYFIDLSMCNKYSKFLIINAIFQLIRSSTHDFEGEKLKYLIVIDEAHAILEKPITTNSDDADFIMKEQMAKIFSELLKEYRSRGVGFIIVDQSPSNLFDIISSQPSIKVIFREDYPNNLLFSEDPNERQMLTQLPNRLALVFNGTTGEKYLMKTLDYKLLKDKLDG